MRMLVLITSDFFVKKLGDNRNNIFGEIRKDVKKWKNSYMYVDKN